MIVSMWIKNNEISNVSYSEWCRQFCFSRLLNGGLLSFWLYHCALQFYIFCYLLNRDCNQTKMYLTIKDTFGAICPRIHNKCLFKCVLTISFNLIHYFDVCLCIETFSSEVNI